MSMIIRIPDGVIKKKRHETDNRNDLDILRTENNKNTREILRKVDEIQIYLRNKK